MDQGKHTSGNGQYDVPRLWNKGNHSQEMGFCDQNDHVSYGNQFNKDGGAAHSTADEAVVALVDSLET
jgi:hypothetical protein